MAIIDDEGILVLQADFQEVSFRSSRLRELLEMERSLRTLEESFKTLSEEVQAADDPVGMPRYAQLWRKCRTVGLQDLVSFKAGLRYLNRPIREGDGSDLQVKEWVNRLDNLSEPIQTALQQQALVPLKAGIEEFDIGLSGTRLDYHNLLKREIQNICDLTIVLKNKLEHKPSTPPQNGTPQ